MTKNLERKKKEQTKGRTNRRMLTCNPIMQLVVVDLYTKHEVSKRLEITLTKKCYGITEGRTEGRTEGTMDRCKPVYPQYGHNISSRRVLNGGRFVQQQLFQK